MTDIAIRDTRNPGHFWADNELVDNYLPQIGIYGFAVYMLLCRFARAGKAKLSIPRMASLLGITEPTIRKALRTLAEVSLIDDDGANRTAKTYAILDVKSQKKTPAPKDVEAKPDLPQDSTSLSPGAKPDLGGGVKE